MNLPRILEKFCMRLPGDLADKFAYSITFPTVLFLGILLYLTQQFGRPIECFLPGSFDQSASVFVDSFCWHNHHYYSDLSFAIETIDQKSINRFQWTALVVILSAVSFVVPGVFWKTFGALAAIPIPSMVAACQQALYLEKDCRNDALSKVAARAGTFPSSRDPLRVFAVFLYICTKIMYVIVWIAQLLLVTQLLGMGMMYPYEVLGAVVKGTDWQMSANLPEHILCDFEVRISDRIHRHIIQCHLSHNVNTTNVLILLYLWYSLGFILASLSLLYWLCVMCIPPGRLNFIRGYLEGKQVGEHEVLAKAAMAKFVQEFLMPDGVLFLRLVQGNAGEIIIQELVDKLWTEFGSFNQKTEIRERVNQSADSYNL